MEKTTKTKCYGYIRISTDRQDESKEVQEKRIRAYCEFKNLQLEGIFTDEGVSGSIPIDNRPEGSKLCNLLTKEVKGVICVRPDRLFRSTSDALISVEKWNKLNIELHVVDLNGATLNTTTASGKLIFTILIAYAAFEREQTGERVKSVLGNKKSTGKAYCGSILGFDKVGGELVNGKIKNQKLVPNPDEIAIIEIIKRNSKEMSPEKIANNLNTWGFKAKKGGKFFPSTIQNILKNPIYNEL